MNKNKYLMFYSQTNLFLNFWVFLIHKMSIFSLLSSNFPKLAANL